MQPESLHRPRLIVAEDEPELRASYSYVFASSEYDVTLCQSGRQAFESFVADPSGVFLVLTDGAMEDGSGLWLAQSVREVSRVPVVLLTGNPDVYQDDPRLALVDRTMLKLGLTATVLTTLVDSYFRALTKP